MYEEDHFLKAIEIQFVAFLNVLYFLVIRVEISYSDQAWSTYEVLTGPFNCAETKLDQHWA